MNLRDLETSWYIFEALRFLNLGIASFCSYMRREVVRERAGEKFLAASVFDMRPSVFLQSSFPTLSVRLYLKGWQANKCFFLLSCLGISKKTNEIR